MTFSSMLGRLLLCFRNVTSRVILVTRENRFLCWNHKNFINVIAHVVRAWDVGFSPMAFVG
jgi:hypothetical protein